MTTYREARQAVMNRALTAWGSSSNIQFENEPFVPTQGVSWVRVRIADMPSVMDTLGGTGNRQIQRRAVVYVIISTPANESGSGPAFDLAKTFTDYFECSSFNGLDFMEPASLIPANSQDGLWYTVTVQAPFVYYDVK